MARKKTPTSTNTPAAAVNLDDDEQLVEEVTTVKKIGRERRRPASEEVITVEAEEVEDDELSDGEFDRPFADNSLAGLLFADEDEERFENQFCTIQIRRHPDSMNDKFLTPCGAVATLAPLRNIELTADRMDIEDRVRSEYGGGHYYFQIYYNGRLGKSWKATLADDPAAVARAKAEAAGLSNPQPVTATQPPMQPADPLDSMLASISKMHALKAAMFGDEQKRLENEIADLKAQVAAKAESPAEPKSEQLYILEKALSTPNSSLQEKLLDYAFPAEGGGHWIPETVKTIFDHKEEIGGILAGLLGGFAGRPAAAPPNIAALLKQQPPAGAMQEQPPAASSLPTSSFRRKPVEASTSEETLAETDEESQEVIDAMPVDPAAILTEAEVVEPSPEFLSSISIAADEIADPFADTEKTEDAE